MDQFHETDRDVLMKLMTRVCGLAANTLESLVARDTVSLQQDWSRLQTVMTALNKHLEASLQAAKARSRIKTPFDVEDE